MNARAVRTALTIEMWDTINSAWLELKKWGNGPRSREEFARFLRWVQEASLRFDGSAYRTMLRNDAYWFSRLGLFIERADNTARILDVKYHLLLPAHRTSRRPARLFPVGLDPALGVGADRLSLGLSRKRQAVAGRRSAHAQGRNAALAGKLLRKSACRISTASPHAYGRQGSAQRQARAVRARLQNSRIEEIFQTGLHEFIDDFVEDNNQLGTAIAQQYLM